RVERMVPERRVASISGAVFVLVVVAFVVIFPLANRHEPASGSDDDDANDLGAWALLNGHSPYTQTTYLGNELHQLPGAFLLAAPFAVAGTSALQNLFWLPVFFLVVNRETKSKQVPLGLALLVLCLSPTVSHQIVTGVGYSANTIYVLVG